MNSDLWKPILRGWYRKVKPAIVILELAYGPHWFETVIDKLLLIEPISEGKAGYTCIVHDKYFVIEYLQALDPLERERTVAHEFTHVICLAGGLSGDHHETWRRIITFMGYPEEASREWSNVV